MTKELLLRKIVFADTSEIRYLSRCQILLQYIITCSRQSLSRELCKMVSKTTRKGLSPYPFLSIFSVKFSIPCSYYLNSWNNITAKKSWLIKTNNSRRLWFRISWSRKRFVGFNILLYQRYFFPSFLGGYIFLKTFIMHYTFVLYQWKPCREVFNKLLTSYFYCSFYCSFFCPIQTKAWKLKSALKFILILCTK